MTHSSIEEKLHYANIEFRQYHVIVLLKRVRNENDIESIERMFESFWKNLLVNVIIIHISIDTSIQMVTYFPFVRDCKNFSFKSEVIDNFNKSTMQWNHFNFFPNKVQSRSSDHHVIRLHNLHEDHQQMEHSADRSHEDLACCRWVAF